MKKIIAFIGVLLMICSLVACKSDTNGRTGKDHNQDEQHTDIRDNDLWHTEESDDEPSLSDKTSGKLYPIDAVAYYGDGLAWVRYMSDTAEKFALVNDAGKELYSFSADNNAPGAINGGISYFQTGEGDDRNYYLINYEGKIIASSENNDFDAIIDYSDGLALLYKYEGGMQSSKHLYAVLDKNGNWVQEYRDLACDPYLENIYHDHKYVGDGIFAIEMKYEGDFMFINSHDGNVIYLYNSGASSPSHFNFVNGCTVYLPINWDDPVVSNIPLETVYGMEVIPGPFLLKSDGTYEILKDFNTWLDSVSGGMIIRDKGDYLDLYDYASGNSYQITKYTDRGTTIRMYDDCGVHITVGQDNKKYFTIIDRDGTPHFEPMIGDPEYYSNGYIAYQIDDLWYVCDQDGTLVLEALQDVIGFNNGILHILDGRNPSVYLDLSGNEILTTVYTSK